MFSLFIGPSLFAQIPEPEEGKALIVFYRKKNFKGGGIKFSIKEGEKTYGQLKNGANVFVQTEQGEHIYWSQVISSDAITINVEEGKVNYIKGTVKMGPLTGRPQFNQVDEKKALKEMEKRP